MTAELHSALVRSCPHHCSTVWIQPSTEGCCSGARALLQLHQGLAGKSQAGEAASAPEQLSSSGACAHQHLPGSWVGELEAWRKSQEKQLQVHWHSAVLCPPKQRAAQRQHQLKCQSGLSSALGLTRQEKENSTELAVEYLDPRISGSC